MTLFDRQNSRHQKEIIGLSDGTTGTLSVTAVENDFVERVYENIAWFYDWTFGPTLHPGRLQAIQRMRIQPGDRVLEVGVGTGINVPLYPRHCQVTGIDFSAPMLDKARKRVGRKGIHGVQLLEMDAANLDFEDNTFDIVYAPYVISVVPDPVKVSAEMLRVCRPGGRMIILNHFRSENPVMSRAERLLSPMTVHIGFKADVHLKAFLREASLDPVSIEKVNIPPMWSLITCVKN